MPAWLPLVLFFAKLPLDDVALHKVEMRIAGPLAMVEVWRAVEASVRPAGGRQVGSYFDVDLPAHAALLDWQVVEGRRRNATWLAPRSEVEANAALGIALKMRHLSLPAAPVEEGTDFRVHLVPIADSERAVLHYRYAALAGCRDGRFVLRVPASLEDNPVPAEVSVTIEPLPDWRPLAEASFLGRPVELRPGARQLVVRGTAPARAVWEIAWAHAKPPGTLPSAAAVAGARVVGVGSANGRARKVPRYVLAGLACGVDKAAEPPAPTRVVLLVDRSRSVGQGGMSAGRALAREVILNLPPSVPFNAILFGGQAEPLFALPRLPTREALDAFTNAADPNRLQNGTDVVAALGRVPTLLGGEERTGTTWIVLVTDGALPANQTSARMQAALQSLDARRLKVLVLFVRQYGDEEVPEAAVAEYARFAGQFGGMVRVVGAGNAGENARAILAEMARGGDLLEVRLEDGKLADTLPPGRGKGVVLTTAARLPREKRIRVWARALNGEVRAEMVPSLVQREWLAPLDEHDRGKRRAWSGATDGMAIAVMPGPAILRQPPDGVVRGRMDPGVLRNALALAFTPRARACYLSRRAVKAGDAYLHGRLKLELTLERGELHDAVVRQSTLDHPGVEECVRKAAWAVAYPRPEHRDAPTVANVNLVFRPRTPQERPPDASAMDREIELILGPLTFPNDYRDLLQDRAPAR